MNQSFYGTYKNTQAARSMQYSMTSLNNLALVLAESLDQMQNQMRQNNQKKKSGQCKNKGKSGQCSNPGKGKPSAKSMKQGRSGQRLTLILNISGMVGHSPLKSVPL